MAVESERIVDHSPQNESNASSTNHPLRDALFKSYMTELLTFGLATKEFVGAYKFLSSANSDDGIQAIGYGIALILIGTTTHSIRKFIINHNK